MGPSIFKLFYFDMMSQARTDVEPLKIGFLFDFLSSIVVGPILYKISTNS